MTEERYYTAGDGEIVLVAGVPRWRLTMPCEHRHGAQDGAVACAQARGVPLVAEFTERRVYGPDADLRTERALTAVEDRPLREREAGASVETAEGPTAT